jgi:hypothetical protein
MPEYRIYTIGGDGRAWSAEDIEYRDDQEAIQKARWIVRGRDVELWKRGRFIARLPGTPRAQGWRFEGLSRAQIETGVMPGAPHRVVDHETVGKRAMIVRAMRPDRENVMSPPHQ